MLSGLGNNDQKMSIMQYWCSVLFFEFFPSVVVSCMWVLQLLRVVWVYAQTYIHKLNCKYFFAIVLFYQLSPWKSYSEAVSWEGLSDVAQCRKEGKINKMDRSRSVFWRGDFNFINFSHGFSSVCKSKYFMHPYFQSITSLFTSIFPTICLLVNDIFNSCFYNVHYILEFYLNILLDFIILIKFFIVILNILITFNFYLLLIPVSLLPMWFFLLFVYFQC